MRLRVEQDPILAPEDAHVGADLALVGEQQRVAAGAGREPLDVVRHLPLQELRRLGPGQEQLAAV